MSALLLSFILVLLVAHPAHSGTPSISRCPGTIFRRVSTSTSALSVEWPEPDCGISPTVTHSPGFQFGPGVHTVIYTYGPAGMNPNKRCCSFDIFVSGPEFDLCTQNTCRSGPEEICVPEVDHYTCYKREIQLHNCSSTVIIRKQLPGSVSANWVEPSAYDYLGRPLPRTDYNGSPLEVGEHAMQYTFEDEFGTPAVCSFTVIVAEDTGPGFDYCPGDISIYSSDDAVSVDWLEPGLQANEEGDMVTITQTHSPGQLFDVPSTITVVYTFRDTTTLAENVCSFGVEIRSRARGTFVIKRPDKFVSIATDEQENEPWPRPIIYSLSNDYIATTVYPSRGQPMLGGTHRYPKGFFPVTYTFKDFEDGTELDVVEFVIAYGDTTEDISVTCSLPIASKSSEVPTTVSLMPWDISGADKDLAWREEPDEEREFQLGSTPLLFSAYLPSSPSSGTTCTVTVIVTDDVPPQVNYCPCNITQVAPDGSMSMSVNYHEPTAVDGSGSVNLMEPRPQPPPIAVSVGAPREIRYVFADSSNNIASCEFTITVLQSPEAPPPVIVNCDDMVIPTASASTTIASSDLPVTISMDDGQEIQGLLSPSTLLVNSETNVIATFFIQSVTVATCEFTVTVLDQIPPEVNNCSQMITAQPEHAGMRFLPVNWTEPESVASLSGGELVSQSHYPGRPLPVNQTTVVSYLFVDRTGLETTCYINVTVLEAPRVECSDECSGGGRVEEEPLGLFTNENIVIIVVTAVATFVACFIIFIISICCCTCCCAIEQKKGGVPVPPRGRGDTPEVRSSRQDDGYSETEQRNSRFVIKVPGLGKLPIYGPVYSLHSLAQQRQQEDDEPVHGRGNQGNGEPGTFFANSAFEELDEGTAVSQRVIDHTNDGRSYGYDSTPPTTARSAPAPPTTPRTTGVPPLPPKPSTTNKVPTLSQANFVKMQLELNRIRDSAAPGKKISREIDDSDLYGFDTPAQ